MRKTVLLDSVVLAAFIALPVAAQGGGGMGGMGGMGRGDPTNAVQGTGVLPAGWELRFDPARGRGGVTPPPTPMTAVSFVAMGSGFHVKGGPAAIYYRTADVEKGEFTISAKFVQPRSEANEAFGLFVGGQNLQDSTQSYTYFEIRSSDGKIFSNHRTSNARPNANILLNWTDEPAVNKDGAGGTASNELAIKVTRDSMICFVNGKHVFAQSRAALTAAGANVDGQAGLRINHNIDMQVDAYTVKK